MSIYYIKQKKISIRDIYHVYTDIKEKPILEVIDNNFWGFLDNMLGNIFSFPRNFTAKNTEEKDIFTVHKKMGFIWEKYDLIINSKVIASISQEKTLAKPKIIVSTQNEKYTISSNVLAKKFLIKKNNILVCEINKKIFSLGDMYELHSYEREQDELFIAVTIAIDNSFHH